MIKRVIYLASIPMLAVCWLVPEHSLPWTSWHGEAFAFLTILIISWVAVMRSARGESVRPVALPTLVWPFILLALLVLVQTAMGHTAYGADVAIWLYTALCLMGITLGYSITRCSSPAIDASTKPWSVEVLLASILIFAGVVSTFIAFAQAFDVWLASDWIVRMPDLRRPGGNMAQPNHLATLLVMAMASALYLLGERHLSCTVSGLLWWMLSAGLAATESRAGLLSLGVLLLWWLSKRPAVSPQLPTWWGLAAGGVAISMFLAWPSLLRAVHMMGEVPGRLVEGSLRLEVWPQLIEAVLMRPWRGWGFGNVAEAHNAVAHAYAVSEPYIYSHNLVLDLALWFGIPATVALVAVTALWLWRRLRAANNGASWYALAVVLPVGVHAMFEFPYAYAYFLVPVMLALGVLEGRLGGRPLRRFGLRPAAGLLLTSSVLMLWSAVEYLRIEEEFAIARFEALRIGQTPAGHERPRVMLLTQLSALVDSTRIPLRPGMAAAQLEQLRRGAMYYPRTATQYRYALALALNDQGEEAARQMQVLRAQHGEKIYAQLREQLQQRLAEHAVAHDKVRLP